MIRYPLISLLANDLGSVKLIQHLDEKSCIDDVIYTLSECDRQHIWARIIDKKFNVHMIHYSENCIPYKYKGEQGVYAFSNMKRYYSDVQWVWTKNYKEYIEKTNKYGKIHVVGSINWQHKYPEWKELGNKQKFIVGCYDITPISNNCANSELYYEDYCNSKNMSEFVKNVIQMVKEIRQAGHNIEIELKSKRKFNSEIYEQKYEDLLNKFAGEFNWFNLVSYTENVHQMIQRCNVIICYPLTSPAIIAIENGIQSVYFDVCGKLDEKMNLNKKVCWATSREQLGKIVLKSLENWYRLNKV